MTSAQLLERLKDRLGNTNYGLTDPQLYRYLTGAKKWIEERTWITFRASVAVKITAGNTAITLNATYVDLTASCTVLAIKKVQYDDNPPLKLVPVYRIRQLREYCGESGEPTIYAFHRPAGVAKLELYPSISVTATDFSDPTLVIDILERTTDISASIEPLTPSYVEDAIYLRAAYDIQSAFGDPRRFDLHNARGTGDFDSEFRSVKDQSYAESSGAGRLTWSVVH